MPATNLPDNAQALGTAISRKIEDTYDICLNPHKLEPVNDILHIHLRCNDRTILDGSTGEQHKPGTPLPDRLVHHMYDGLGDQLDEIAKSMGRNFAGLADMASGAGGAIVSILLDESWQRSKPPVAPLGVDIDENITIANMNYDPIWFYNQVKNGGPWDYKQLDSKYENFGNFHYGAVGSAFGFPTAVLLNEAGRAQRAAGTSKKGFGEPGLRLFPWTGDPPYGDDPKDQYWIRQGIDFYRNRHRWESPTQEAP